MSNPDIAYYPGCSGKGSSEEYDRSTRAVMHQLGVTPVEIEDWSCCGSSPAHMVNHDLSAALSGRNLAQARHMGHTLVTTPCPSCLSNLKNAAQAAQNPDKRRRINRLMDGECPTDVESISTLQFFLEQVGLDAIRAAVTKPLTGLRIACYYGCLTTRPPQLMQFDDPENPMSMDAILEACGINVIPFPLKTDCCGASSGMPRNDISTRLSGKILDMAGELDVDAIAVACPLCQMNLDLRQAQVNRACGTRHRIPVFYFTQLMGLTMGLSDKALGLSKLEVNPQPCLARAGAR
jgi:heterodisulfide reductase subunit B